MHRRSSAAAVPDRDGLGPRWAWVLVALVAVLHAAPFFVAFIEGDFARDLHVALSIAQGRDWPVEGPIISRTLNLGPVWYYTLAVPLKLGGSITAVVATIAIISSLKFGIAYRLGSEVFDRRTGLAWALMLALPGIGSLESFWMAHPSVTATLTLFVLFALWRAWSGNAPVWLAAAGAGLGLALHAHPTTLPLALPLAWVAWGHMRSLGRAGLAGALAAVLLAALPFAPLLVDAGTHFDAALRLGGEVSSDATAWSTAAFGTVLTNTVWRVPDLIVGTWVSDDGSPLAAWRFFVTVVYATAAIGLVLVVHRGPPRLRRVVICMMLAFVAWIAFVTAIRGVTRFYMLYAAMPLFALLLALGIAGLARMWGAAGSAAVRVLLAGVVIASATVQGMRVARALEDDVRLPPVLGAHVDLRDMHAAEFWRLHLLSVRDVDYLGRRLCLAGRVHAFGELAQVLDTQLNVAARARCGDASHVVLGGEPGPGEHAFFLVQRSALQPRAALRDVGGFGFGHVAEVLVHGPALPLARGDDYPARKGCGSPTRHRYDFVTSRVATLVVSNAFAATCPMRVVGLTRDGTPQPLSAAADSWFARVPGAPASWSLDIETAAPEAVQVFTIADPAPPGG